MDLIDGYLSWLEYNKGRAERTTVKYRQSLERLGEYLQKGGHQLQQATRDELQQFAGLYAHTDLKLTPRARRPLVAAIRGFYRWAVVNGHMTSNPADDLDYPKAGRRLPRAMSLGNAEKLLMQCDMNTFLGVRDAAVLSILIGCGPRISGVMKLNQEDLVWYDDDGRERLAIRFKEKGDKERLVPAPIEVALMIHAYLGHRELETVDRTIASGEQVLFISTRNNLVPAHEYHGEARRLSERSFFKRLRLYGERARVPEEELHHHAMRHLFGTELAESDVDILLRQDLLGHSDPKTTEIYTSLAMRKKAQVVDMASPLRKIQTPVSGLVPHIERRR